MSGARELSLPEVAEALQVHYMTAYRYVRQGRLRARKDGARWLVKEDDVARFAQNRARMASVRGEGRADIGAAHYLDRLIAGDRQGAWDVLSAHQSAARPAALYLDIIAPALEIIGARWAAGELGINVEHHATSIVGQHLGRLSPLFTRAGRRRGTIVVGCPPTETHALGLTMVADLLAVEGFVVSNLGPDTPVEAFVAEARASNNLLAIGISIHHPRCLPQAIGLVEELRAALPGAPILVGGRGALDPEIQRLKADHVSIDIAATLDWLDTNVPTPGGRGPVPPPTEAAAIVEQRSARGA